MIADSINDIPDGYLSSGEYQAKYVRSGRTIWEWGRDGRLGRYRVGREWYYEDRAPDLPKKKKVNHNAKSRRCRFCRRWKDRDAYPGSLWARGLCKECVNVKARADSGNIVDRATVNREAAAFAEIESLGVDGRRERKGRIKAHAERIEAMGLAGDGEDWPDAE